MTMPGNDKAGGAGSDDLTIRDVRARLVEMPMRFALGTSADVVRVAPLLLVDLPTEEGITGQSYLFCYRRPGGRAFAEGLNHAFDRLHAAPLTTIPSTTVLARLASVG